MNEREINLKREKPKVGDVLYLRSHYLYSDNGSIDLYEVTVKKVGRQFFTVDRIAKGRFWIENWEYEQSAHCQLYATQQERIDEVERNNALLKLRRFNDHGRLSTSALHEILAIIERDLTPPSA